MEQKDLGLSTSLLGTLVSLFIKEVVLELYLGSNMLRRAGRAGKGMYRD